VLTQIAADAVGVSHELVEQVHPDTQTMPWDQTTSSSRSTMIMGAAIQDAAAKVGIQLLELAGEALGPELELVRDGVRTPDGRHASFAELVQASGHGSLQAAGRHVTEGHLDPDTGLGVATSAVFQGAAAADVEVDVETGKVTVVGLDVAVWAGRVSCTQRSRSSSARATSPSGSAPRCSRSS
jgi:CO/xanthine dehydrogenase Mo-binding subunit